MTLLLALTLQAHAWGPTGHRTVAALAAERIRPRTARRLRALLGHESLAEGSTWPDWIRSDPERPDLGRWHYLSVQRGQGVEAAVEAAGDAPHILQAIPLVQATLADRDADPETRREALRWLVHLVGDLHQPLHTAPADDRGGNLVAVTYQGTPSNLHRVWDEDLIDFERWSYTELAAVLAPVTDADARAWTATSPTAWAAENQPLLEVVYDVGDGSLSWDYRYRAWPIVTRRLQQAGVRLASLLDEALR